MREEKAEAREFNLRQASQENWSVRQLQRQIETRIFPTCAFQPLHAPCKPLATTFQPVESRFQSMESCFQEVES